MVADGRFDDIDDVDGDDVDGDAPWRPQSDPGQAPVADVAEPSPDPRPDQRSDEDHPIERIVLNHEGSASLWARPSGGRDDRDDHDRAEEPDLHVSSRASSTISGAAAIGEARASKTEVGSLPGAPEQPTDPDEPADGEHRRHGRRRRVMVAVLAGVLVIVVAVGLLVSTRGGDPEPVAASTPELPAAAEIAWTRRVDGEVAAMAAGDGLVVVASGAGITALSEADGEVLWRRVNSAGAGDVDRVAVLAGHVVVTQQGTTGTTEVRAFDRENGTELWRTRGNDGSFSIVGPSHDPIIVGRSRVDEGTVLTLLDAADGTVLADPVRLSGVEVIGGDFAAAPTDRKVAVWSADDLDVVAGPVDEFNLRTIAELDGGVVALDLEGRIVAFDGDGRRTDELVLVGSPESLDDGVEASDVDFVGITTSGIGVVSDRLSVGFTVVDGRIETVWELPGFVVEPVATANGDRSVLITRGGADGEIVESVIDSTSGDLVTTIASPGPRERISRLAWNGFVVAPTVGASERVVSAVGYDGELLWSLPLSPEADYEVTEVGIVIVEPASEGADVSVAR